jgi:hypothetical protein
LRGQGNPTILLVESESLFSWYSHKDQQPKNNAFQNAYMASLFGRFG